MAKAKKAKGKKIFKIAKECNLSHITLTEYLNKKGYKVSGPNDTVTDEIYEIILSRFSAEKMQADKIRARRKKEDEALEEAVTASDGIAKDDLPQEEKQKEEIDLKAKDGVVEETAEEQEKPAKTEKDEVYERIIKDTDKEEQKEEIRYLNKGKSTKQKDKEVKEIKEENAKQKVSADTEKTNKKQSDAAKTKPKKSFKAEPVKSDVEERGLSPKERKRKKAIDLIKKEGKKSKHKIKVPEIINADESVTTETKQGKIGRPKKRKKKRREVDQKAVSDTLKKTLADMGATSKKRKKKKIVKDDGQIEEVNVIQVTEFMSVQDLAKVMDIDVSEVIKTCMTLGMLVTINQRLEMDTIKIISDEFGFEVEETELESEILDEVIEEQDDDENLEPRAPVVTVMGHVDHGKTSFLDYIRSTNVIDGESGGITQHIGAYEVEVEGKGRIAFLDTPGHEAFTAMRARGAQVTDIVVLVIAADDRVMPQTNEALDHALAAEVSIIIAINKCDKPSANPEKIKKQLADRNILVEDWGGKYQCVEISAKTGQNVDELLEKILLEAEMLELRANPDRNAQGTIIESKLDKGKGAVATILIQKGTLKVGNVFVAGSHWGKVRALLDEKDNRVETAGPSTPVQVLGFDGVPEAGDKFVVIANEQRAKEIALKRQQIRREQELRIVRKISLEHFSEQVKMGEIKELNILIKSDVAGSSQALADSLSKLSTDEVKVNIVRSAVGPITESDVLLAEASNAVIAGFHVRPNIAAKTSADKINVQIRLYKIIYDLENDVRSALEGMLAPVEREVIVGTVEIRETFKISRLGTIAGCHVLSGKIKRNNHVRLIRNDIEIYEGELTSLKRFKEDVKEVASGFECGIMIKNYNDIKIGDVIESFETIEEKKALDGSIIK